MAKLKCWKSVQNTKHFAIWDNKIYPTQSVFVSKKKGNPGVIIIGKIDKAKEFKKISEALKFAKSYMKKHDKC